MRGIFEYHEDQNITMPLSTITSEILPRFQSRQFHKLRCGHHQSMNPKTFLFTTFHIPSTIPTTPLILIPSSYCLCSKCSHPRIKTPLYSHNLNLQFNQISLNPQMWAGQWKWRYTPNLCEHQKTTLAILVYYKEDVLYKLFTQDSQNTGIEREI